MHSQSLDSLSPTKRRLVGAAMTCLGLLVAWIVGMQPDKLRAPPWVAYVAASCFGVAGLAVFLHASASRKTYAWLVACLLCLMALVSAWVAFGPGERQCSATPLLASELGCRIAFALGTFVLLGFVAAAVASARRLARAA